MAVTPLIQGGVGVSIREGKLERLFFDAVDMLSYPIEVVGKAGSARDHATHDEARFTI